MSAVNYRELIEENARKNRRKPAKAYADFLVLVTAIRENQAKGTELEAQRKLLSAVWTGKRDDINFRQQYARVKTARDTANRAVVNSARRANKLLGQDILRTKGWQTVAPATSSAAGGESCGS